MKQKEKKNPNPNILSRREFMEMSAFLTSSAFFSGCKPRLYGASLEIEEIETFNMLRGAREPVIQPILTYQIPVRQKARSWRPWGGLESRGDVEEELSRIKKELDSLCASSDFPLRVLPTVKLTDSDDVSFLKNKASDVLLVYAAGGWTDLLQRISDLGKYLIFFVRFKTGPYYLWHEIIHARFLRSHTDNLLQKAADFHDVVVDDIQEIQWRLKALFGLKNILGRKIICIGGPAGWSTPQAPELAKQRWNLEMITVPIVELEKMINKGRSSREVMSRVRDFASKYSKQPSIFLEIPKEALTEAFLLAEIFLGLLKENDAQAITVNSCMGSYAEIMPCLTLTLLNDTGYMAYCESDFVVIPSGILLHFISGKPTFLCNPTYPHAGKMLFAHCSAPRRMDGKNLENARIVTHFESDHGAAPKVEMRKGELLTIIKPDFEAREWLAFKGRIAENPFFPVCRSQIEVEIEGDSISLLPKMKGFHAMIAYGDYLREIAYASKKVGIKIHLQF